MKITPEIAEQINEIYYYCKNKSQTAKQIGCSAATVSRYILPDYYPRASRQSYEFKGEVGNADWLVDILNQSNDAGQWLCKACMLSEEELVDLKELQKEIII